MSGWATLDLIQAKTGHQISWKKAANHIRRLKYYAKADILLAETYDDVFLFRGKDQQLLHSFPVEERNFNDNCYKRRSAAELSPDGKSLVIVNNKKELWLFSIGDKADGRLIENNVCISDLTFTSNGDFLITAERSTVKFWDVSTGTSIKKKKKALVSTTILDSNQPPRLSITLGHSKKVSTVDISSDGELLLSGGNDSSQVHLWHLSSGRELCQAGVKEAGKTRAVGFSPDGKFFVGAGHIGSGWPETSFMHVYKTIDCSLEKQLPYGGARLIDFSEDGSLMLVVAEHTATILKTSDWQKLYSFHVSKELFNSLDDNVAMYWKFNQASFTGGNAHILLTSGHELSWISLKEPNKFIWSISIPEKYKTSYGSEVGNYFRALKVDSKENIIVAIARDGYLYQFSLINGKQINKVLVGEFVGKGIEVLADGVVAGNMRLDLMPSLDVLQVWDSHSKTPSQTLSWQKDESSISAIIALFLRNKKLYVIQDNGRVSIVDARGQLQLKKNYKLIGKSGPVLSASFSPNGHKVLLGLTSSAIEGVASIIDLQSSREDKVPGTLIGNYDAAMGPSGDAPEAVMNTRATFFGNDSVVTVNERSLQLVDILNMQQKTLQQRSSLIVAPPRVAVSAAQQVLLYGDGAQLSKYNLDHGDAGKLLKWKFRGQWMMGVSGIHGIVFSKDAKQAVSISDSNKHFALWDVRKSKLIREFGDKTGNVTAVVFSHDEKSIFASHTNKEISQWNIKTGKRIHSFQGSFGVITSMQLMGGHKLLTASKDGSIRVWDTRKGVELERYEAKSGGVNDVSISHDNKFILGAYDDGSAVLWRLGAEQWVAKYISFRDGTWAVVTPDGRYDSNHPGDLPTLSWVMADDPLTPLPVEIFMQEYFEPRLLARVLAGEKFPPLKSLTEINRVQPDVHISSIRPGKSAGLVSVTVEVAGTSKTYQKKGKAVSYKSGVYDLRLFRDGQLVGYAPDQSGKVKLGAINGKAKVTFSDIKLPLDKQGRDVQFSAYAFNVDGIKSSTAKMDYSVPSGLPKRTPRAYVVSIGVNTYQTPDWNLQYAANDAESIQYVISEKLKQTGRYRDGEIITIPLISMKGNEAAAGKARIKAVFDLLAGKNVSPELIASIPNADKIKTANPEDTLIISYSGHGYADDKREFYLFPYDIGTGKERSVAPAVLKRLISSEELSLWLRDVDAGYMTMIVDACNSAASVQGSGFKPGPMGSRGLGQLAYDKGMRILAASQAESVALESSLIRHGVLTYALVEEGVALHMADYLPQDNKIMMGEWLKYGVKRVPKLNQEIERGAISTASRGFTATAAKKEDKLSAYEQQPSLFDFNKRSRDALLMEVKQMLQ